MAISTVLNSFITEPPTYFIAILIGLLLFFLAYAGLLKIPSLNKTKSVPIIIAAVFGILAARWLTADLIETYLRLPYRTLGLALIFGVPYLLYLYVIHRTTMTGIGRKILAAAIGAAVVFFWFTNWNILSSGQRTIYLIAVIVVLITIAFDRGLHALLRKRYIDSLAQ